METETCRITSGSTRTAQRNDGKSTYIYNLFREFGIRKRDILQQNEAHLPNIPREIPLTATPGYPEAESAPLHRHATSARAAAATVGGDPRRFLDPCMLPMVDLRSWGHSDPINSPSLTRQCGTLIYNNLRPFVITVRRIATECFCLKWLW